jgi:hypothetical protein
MTPTKEGRDGVQLRALDSVTTTRNWSTAIWWLCCRTLPVINARPTAQTEMATGGGSAAAPSDTPAERHPDAEIEATVKSIVTEQCFCGRPPLSAKK